MQKCSDFTTKYKYEQTSPKLHGIIPRLGYHMVFSKEYAALSLLMKTKFIDLLAMMLKSWSLFSTCNFNQFSRKVLAHNF